MGRAQIILYLFIYNILRARTKNSGVEAGTLSFYMFSLAIIWGSSPELQTK